MLPHNEKKLIKQAHHHPNKKKRILDSRIQVMLLSEANAILKHKHKKLEATEIRFLRNISESHG